MRILNLLTNLLFLCPIGLSYASSYISLGKNNVSCLQSASSFIKYDYSITLGPRYIVSDYFPQYDYVRELNHFYPTTNHCLNLLIKDRVSGTLHVLKLYNDENVLLHNMMRREIKALNNLAHKDIVNLRAQDNFPPHLLTNYIDGQTLAAVFEQLSNLGRPLSKQQIFTFFAVTLKSLLEIVEFVHNKGYLHLDLKPGNIIVQNDHTISLIDFGNSLDLANNEIISYLAFTEHYSPIRQQELGFLVSNSNIPYSALELGLNISYDIYAITQIIYDFDRLLQRPLLGLHFLKKRIVNREFNKKYSTFIHNLGHVSTFRNSINIQQIRLDLNNFLQDF